MTPDSCIFPYTKKGTKIINLRCPFFVTSSNLFMIDYMFSKQKSSYILWLLAYLFGAVPQSYLRGCLPGYSPQQGPQIKLNLQLLHCAFFFQVTLYLRPDVSHDLRHSQLPTKKLHWDISQASQRYPDPN